MPDSSIAPPSINARAWLSLSTSIDELFPTRVEDSERHGIVIGAPLTHNGSEGITTLEAPAENQTCTLLWSLGEVGYAQQHCRVVRVTESSIPTWTCKFDGPAELVQRRAFVRVPEDAQAHLHFSDRTVDVQIMDLSEGGLRCTARAFPVGIDHLPCYADLLIANHQVMLPANVVRVEEQLDGTMELGVQFYDVADIHANLIRRHVFSRQLHLRKDEAS